MKLYDLHKSNHSRDLDFKFQFYSLHVLLCKLNYIVTINSSYIFANIFQMQHISDVNFLKGDEKNKHKAFF